MDHALLLLGSVMSSTIPFETLDPVLAFHLLQDNGLHDPATVDAVLTIQNMWYLYREYQAMVHHLRGFKELTPTFARFLRIGGSQQWKQLLLGWWGYWRWREFTLRKRRFKTITQRKLLPALLMEGSIVSSVAQFI